VRIGWLNRDQFTVYTRTLAGKTITFDDVTPSTTLMELAGKVEAREGIPAAQITFIWQSKALDSNGTLGDWCIPHRTTMTIISRRDGLPNTPSASSYRTRLVPAPNQRR
jgi:hypothetical protein